MRRVCNAGQRPNWRRIVEEEGVVHQETPTPDGSGTYDYWRESAFYRFTQADVDTLFAAAKAMFRMFDLAGDWLEEHPEFLTQMGIPEFAHEAMLQSWNRSVPNPNNENGREYFGSVYGRFDVCFGGVNHPDPRLRVPKFYEFNADTPTVFVESMISQWSRYIAYAKANELGETFTQWNEIFEMLVAAWRRNLNHVANHIGHWPTVYFACSNAEDSGEDETTTIAMMETCERFELDLRAELCAQDPTRDPEQPVFEIRRIYIEQVGMGTDGYVYDNSREYDPEPVHIEFIWKLYPWEFIWNEPFGNPELLAEMNKELPPNERIPNTIWDDMLRIEGANGVYAGGTFWAEPLYKAMWSNKAIFIVLWKLFGKDPELSQYLLPTFWADEEHEMLDRVEKPCLGREGVGVSIFKNGVRVCGIEDDAGYGKSGFVAQALHELPAFYDEDENPIYPMVGIWMVDGDPAGIGIREDATIVTGNGSYFVWHLFEYDSTED